jgi:hypothetical protein
VENAEEETASYYFASLEVFCVQMISSMR